MFGNVRTIRLHYLAQAIEKYNCVQSKFIQTTKKSIR